ncbi:hypothetical protein BDQ17DRAFT_1429919 [Cyathus striatus]|nr:hypothetical protein BDQ17DRAFT_1429919 [Cyathus striatus]
MSHYASSQPLVNGLSNGVLSTSFGIRTPSESREDHPSPTSEDGTYGSFQDGVKGEGDIDDDNSSLISQTLNADGTPKRPMNAFMIFARRRRPQVSAENQSMRTGEISKILSKEWNSMPSQEKQFYLDSAKQLKDSFNSKYPDYVYRRRPNNSRRRRRADSSSMRSVDGLHVSDGGEDYAGNADPGEISPVDDEGHLDLSRDIRFSRAPAADLPQTYGNYSFPDESTFRSAGTPNARLSISSNGERLNHSVAALPTPRMHQSGHNLQGYGYLGAQPEASQYGTESLNSSDNWHGRHGMWSPANNQQVTSASKSFSSSPQFSWTGTSTGSSTSMAGSYPLPSYSSFSPSNYGQASETGSQGTSSSSSYGSPVQSMRSVPPYLNGRDYNSPTLGTSPPVGSSLPFSDHKEYVNPYMPSRSNSVRVPPTSNPSRATPRPSILPPARPQRQPLTPISGRRQKNSAIFSHSLRIH